ncbi:MAG: EI24 domain-containing protein [Sinobacteraceae bacterium]|nr:EI24 domain-containing protein [Nevskiaceae bacterium]
MNAALAAALRDFFTPRMLGLVLWPLLGAALLWGLLAYFFWGDLVHGLQHLATVPALERWLGPGLLRWLAEFSVAVALFLILPPLVQASALLITSAIALPIMVAFVAARDYPDLERRRGGTLIGSLANAVAATLLYLLAWLVCLPLWLFGLPALVLPLVLNAWLNQRLFRYDALSEHASRQEYRRFCAAQRGRLFGLGLVAAALQLVPILNLVVPVYAGLSFVHFGFAELRRMRAHAA